MCVLRFQKEKVLATIAEHDCDAAPASGQRAGAQRSVTWRAKQLSHIHVVTQNAPSDVVVPPRSVGCVGEGEGQSAEAHNKKRGKNRGDVDRDDKPGVHQAGEPIALLRKLVLDKDDVADGRVRKIAVGAIDAGAAEAAAAVHLLEGDVAFLNVQCHSLLKAGEQTADDGLFERVRRL